MEDVPERHLQRTLFHRSDSIRILGKGLKDILPHYVIACPVCQREVSVTCPHDNKFRVENEVRLRHSLDDYGKIGNGGVHSGPRSTAI
jgi:hypothetical protein